MAALFNCVRVCHWLTPIHNSNKEGKKLKGIRLKVKGNGEKYHIFIQTTIFYRLPTGYQIATFDTSPNWQTVDLPFDQFKELNSNKNSKSYISNASSPFAM